MPILSTGSLYGLSSGPALWTPAQLGSALLAWYKGDTLSGSNGDPIGTWPNAQGTGGRDLTQSTAAKPTLVTADLNSKNVLRFTAASSQFIQTGASNFFTSATAGSLYLVIKTVADPAASGASSGIMKFATAGSADHFPFTDGNIYNGFGSTVRKTVGNPSVSLASYRIASWHSASADWRFYLDGGAGGTSGGTTALFSTGTNTVGFETSSSANLGRSDDGVGGLVYLNGWIAEAVFTNAVQTTGDRQKVEGYLAHKWALASSNLDTTHPYKSTAPTV